MVERGEQVRVVTTKWGDQPHWEYDATYLGADEHGDWVGLPRGTHLSRPGASFDAETAQVCLVPRDRWWIATFHAPGYKVSTYVDMTSPAVWDGPTVTAIDLDLDVVELTDGSVYVDDEDEFAEHQARWSYPPETITGAEASCRWVHDAVVARRAPYDGASAQRWFGELDLLTGSPASPVVGASGPDGA